MVANASCGEKEAAWGDKYFSLLFMLDDHLDDISNFCPPEKLFALFLELNVVLMWSFPDDEEFYKRIEELLDEGDVAEWTKPLNYLHMNLDEYMTLRHLKFILSARHFANCEPQSARRCLPTSCEDGPSYF
ncbi:unnamed protein product [Calypogeia fissa]